MFERFTERARQVVVLARSEAEALKHNYIGTEHVLLGLVREERGVAARILLDFDADPEKIRNEIMLMLSGPGRRSEHYAYDPKSPPLAAEFVGELESVRTQKEQAIEALDFERAASLRDCERRLSEAARELERVWEGRAPDVSRRHGPVGGVGTEMSVLRGRFVIAPGTLLLGWLLFGAALGFGLLVGWLIWG